MHSQTLSPVIYTPRIPCDRPLEVELEFDDHAMARQSDLYGKSGIFKRCLDLTAEFKTEQSKSDPSAMLPVEYLNVSQCPNFIEEDPTRIAEFLADYETNLPRLFETVEASPLIGENFKRRLREVIGSVK